MEDLRTDLMLEGNAVIGDLEMELIKMEEKKDYWRNAWQEACDREASWANKAYELEKQATTIETLVRNILDEAAYEDDDTNVRELRKMLWSDLDTEKRIERSG